MSVFRYERKGTPEGTGFTLIPEGEYNVSIVDVVKKVTPNGDDMFKITLSILDDAQKNKKIWDNIVFPEENSPAIGIKGRTLHFLHAINQPYEDTPDGAFPVNTDDWIGQRAYVKVIHSEYKGKMGAKIGEYIIGDDEVENDVENKDESTPF